MSGAERRPLRVEVLDRVGFKTARQTPSSEPHLLCTECRTASGLNREPDRVPALCRVPNRLYFVPGAEPRPICTECRVRFVSGA